MIRDVFRMLSIEFGIYRHGARLLQVLRCMVHVLPEELGQGKEERSELRALSRILPRV